MTDAPSATTDVLIVGAGIAGASLAAQLAPYRRVMMIEAEDMPGYHATGRSAAFWLESYGGVQVQPLTAASGPFLAHPDPEFSDHPFLLPRSALIIGRREERSAVDAFVEEFSGRGVDVARLSTDALRQQVPGLRPEWTEAALEASCRDIDVGGLHLAYLKAARKTGAVLATRTALLSARHNGRHGWTVETGQGRIHAATLVNAAGAWADHVARACDVAPIGIQPYRRTVAQIRFQTAVPASLPLISHIGGEFYFKGESEGRVWLSPHDETASLACDAAPEEMDVALAIDRLQQVVDWPIAAVERKWAGLRSFAPDRLPVFGLDPHQPDFFWCAGQGGFGIQTVPAISALLAEQMGGAPAPAAIGAIDARPFSPLRFSG
ncbi:NAD(P)/FAD-dependent oxidoreductase [Sphingopyxis sp. MWB1]|uniref:NAD(P)/FAD-dependent oxidoreductase n=1 Tax=Sphingopyxis sp. MWB1 TaxID=1537715 RepID=UPI00051A6F80|nr:FAD-dependent oxidoreductase [Sphingopyxis sp. MWB1]